MSWRSHDFTPSQKGHSNAKLQTWIYTETKSQIFITEVDFFLNYLLFFYIHR